MSEPDVASEMRKAQHEPLLPVEKKLIVGSLGLGLILLAILFLATRGAPEATEPAPSTDSGSAASLIEAPR